jgi:hypothetical protein
LNDIAETLHHRMLELVAEQRLPRPQFDRNPFTFVASNRVPAASKVPAATPQVEPIGVPGSEWPPLKLVGIAEDRRPAGIERTAILVANGDELLFAKVGDDLVGGFTVTLIDEMSIQITHQVSRAARCLALAGEDHAACTRLTLVHAPGMQGGQ